MGTILGLFGVVGYMLAVIAIAAGVTWAVVKLTPARGPAPSE
ncbi:MAG: hypothetical protein ABR521_08100 [Gaiellaceae bacterium]